MFMKIEDDEVIYKIRMENLLSLNVIQFANPKDISEYKAKDIKKCIRAAHKYMKRA